MTNARSSVIESTLVKEDPDFKDIVEEFVAGLPDRLARLQSALDAGDVESLRKLAHQLKGGGGGHGYDVITEVASRTEKDAIQQQIDALQNDIDELKDIVSRVVVKA